MSETQIKIKKHRIYDHPIIGAIVGMILTLLAYILLIGIAKVIYPSDTDIAASIRSIIAASICLLFHAFYFRGDIQNFFKVKGFKKGFLLGWSIIAVALISLVDDFIEQEQLGSVIVALISGLAPGLSEETIFRIIPLSIAMRKLEDKKKLLIPCIITSLPFGLLHLANIFMGADVTSSIIQVLYAIAIGILLAGIYVRTKNMWAIIGLHTFMDFIASLSQSMQDSGGILTESVNTASIIILLCFTIAFYINAIGVWRTNLKK